MLSNIRGLESLPFRIFVLCIGIVLIPLFGIFFVAAWAHFPATWVGVIYSLYGLVAGICGIVYFFRKEFFLLLVVAPAAILMALTWSGLIS